jgi:lipoprotein-releasing system ATP-binding protein
MNQAAATTATSLKVMDLYKEYPTPAEPLVVLRGVSMELAGGQSMAILGPSGSGKSTLLNVLGTLDRATRGQVMLDGTDLSTLAVKELARFRSARIGFVFQDHHLLPQCTAQENVLVARLAAGRVRGEDVQRAAELLAKVGLANRLTHRPSELSGGERQRVAIARALMNHPTLLLCDEPTGNLDQKTSHVVGELLSQLARDAATMLIVVTHSASLASMFSRQAQMEDGRLVEV